MQKKTGNTEENGDYRKKQHTNKIDVFAFMLCGNG